MDLLLLVGIDRSLAEDLSVLLREDGCVVESVPEGTEVLPLLKEKVYQVVVLDISPPSVDGQALISSFRSSFPDVDIMIVADDAAVDVAAGALEAGACDLLVKPLDSAAFARRVRVCREKRRLRAENEELKRQVALYRATQNISNCLDLDQLGNLVVSALVAEAGICRGLGIFLDEEGLLSLKGMKEMDETSQRALAELIMSGFQHRDREEHVVLLTDFVPDGPAHEFAQRADLREALVVGVYTRNVLQGIVALFNDPGKPLPGGLDLQNLRFLAEQSSRALENATRFTNARNLINIDELTGLFNYRYLEIALDREIKRAERYRSSLSIVFLDLDQFKEVNDTHGHLVGSKVLREIGLLLKSLVREVDTVIRYGGDEYTIILVESTIVGAARVAERIRSAVEARSFLVEEGLNIRLTASLGYACYPDDSQSHVELLQMADQAMYRGKFSGKNVVFHIGQTKEQQGE